MARPRRAGRRRRRAPNGRSTAAEAAFIPLPPAPLQLLSDDQVTRLHEATLAILERTGVRLDHPAAVNHFRQAGARVQGDRVFLSPDLLTRCLATAPRSFVLHGRHPARAVVLGGHRCVVMPGGGPPYVADLDGRRRPGTLADVANFARLTQLSPAVHVAARKAVEAQDVPPAHRHLRAWQTILTLTDKPGQSGFPGGRPEVEDVLQMLAIVHGGEETVAGRPVMLCSVNANSPLQFDRPMLDSLLLCAGYGQPVLVSSFVMAGATGPTTLAGALAQHNAEVLTGVALVQLVRPGSPVVYGLATSNADLRSGAPAIGSPESALSVAVCAQLARFYGLPCRGGGALTDSPVADGQSQYERMFTLLTSALSGVHYLMHGLGILESYLTLGYAQFVIDLELLEMVRQLLTPLDISPETLALEAIDAVGPGGHFLDAGHTLRHFRHAHYLPRLSVRQTLAQWQAAGGQDVLARATARCREMLAAYSPPPMETAVAARLADFVARRQDELPAD